MKRVSQRCADSRGFFMVLRFLPTDGLSWLGLTGWVGIKADFHSGK